MGKAVVLPYKARRHFRFSLQGDIILPPIMSWGTVLRMYRPPVLRACKGFDRDLKACITLQSGILLICHLNLNAEDNLAMVA